MKLLMALAFLALFFNFASANYHIWRVQITSFHSGSWRYYGWSAMSDHPSCDESKNVRVLSDRSDVSNDKWGVRCKGKGCSVPGEVGVIDELEMNWAGPIEQHWTLYKSRRDESQWPWKYHLDTAESIPDSPNEWCIMYPIAQLTCQWNGGRTDAWGMYKCNSNYSPDDFIHHGQQGGDGTLGDWTALMLTDPTYNGTLPASTRLEG